MQKELVPNIDREVACPDMELDSKSTAVNIRLIAVPILLAIFVAVLTIVGASWIRGSDQYWYLADVERLMANGGLVSNIYFPVSFLGLTEAGASENYIYHNGPMLYLSAWVGKYLGAFNGWITLNLVFHFFNSVVIFLCSSRITNRSIAITVTSFYLVSPIAIWQSLNVLQEQYFSAVMAVVVICYLNRQNTFARLLLIAGLGLGVLSHPIFVVLAVVYACFVVVEGVVARNLSEVTVGILILVVSLLLKSVTHHVFPTSWFPDFASLVGGTVPSKSNIYWYLTDAVVTVDMNLMKEKFIDAVNRQFFVLRNAPLYIFTNLSMMGMLYLLLRKWSKLKWIILPAGAVLGAYVCMVLLVQNSHRYQQIVAPVTFIVIAVVVHELGVKVRRTAVVPCLALFMVIGICLSFYMKQHSELERSSVDALTRDFADVVAESNILVYETGYGSKVDLQLGYILPDAKILRLKPEFLSDAAIGQVLEGFNPEFVLSNEAGLNIGYGGTTLVNKIDGITRGGLYLYTFNSEETVIQVVSHAANGKESVTRREER